MVFIFSFLLYSPQNTNYDVIWRDSPTCWVPDVYYVDHQGKHNNIHRDYSLELFQIKNGETKRFVVYEEEETLYNVPLDKIDVKVQEGWADSRLFWKPNVVYISHVQKSYPGVTTQSFEMNTNFCLT